MEKMPSASNSPIIGRKVSSEDVNSKKGQPLSVASMVRRFERDTGLEHKNRGGEISQLERSNSSLNKESSKSVVKESRSSSRNSSLDSSQGNIPAAVSLTEIEAVEKASSSAEAVVVSEVKPVQTQKASTSKSTTSKSTTAKSTTAKSTTAKATTAKAATAAVTSTSETSETSETSAKPSKTVRKFIYL